MWLKWAYLLKLQNCSSQHGAFSQKILLWTVTAELDPAEGFDRNCWTAARRPSGAQEQFGAHSGQSGGCHCRFRWVQLCCMSIPLVIPDSVSKIVKLTSAFIKSKDKIYSVLISQFCLYFKKQNRLFRFFLSVAAYFYLLLVEKSKSQLWKKGSSETLRNTSKRFYLLSLRSLV